MQITITLSLDNVNGLLNLLGEQPTKLGLWPLVMDIKQQAEAQIKSNETPKGEE